MLPTLRTSLDARAAKRFVLAPAIGLALVVGAAPASANSHCSHKPTSTTTRGQSSEHQVAGSGTGRRIR